MSALPTMPWETSMGQNRRLDCASDNSDAYELLRANVTLPRTITMMATVATDVRRERRDSSGLAIPAMTSAVIAMSGRYIRRSAPTSVTMGTNDDVGASVMKTHAPAKPTAAFQR